MSYYIIEGVDGSGKDTQGDLLAEHLSKKHKVLRVNEPDNSLPTGQLLREMLKDGSYVSAHAALFLADRMAMLSERVIPALQKNQHVVSVRSWMSTLVYQQENWPLEWLFALHKQLPARANHLILLDLDPEEALGRATLRPGHTEFYEKVEIQQRNRQRYLDIASKAKPFLAEEGKVHVIDASGNPAVVHQKILVALGLR